MNKKEIIIGILIGLFVGYGICFVYQYLPLLIKFNALTIENERILDVVRQIYQIITENVSWDGIYHQNPNALGRAFDTLFRLCNLIK